MLRRLPLLTLLLAAPVWGQEKKLVLEAVERDPKAVVQSAIVAAGGAAVIDRYPAGRLKIKGVQSAAAGNPFAAGIGDIPFTGTVSYFLPGRMRTAIDATANGQKATVVHVQDGDTFAAQSDGKPLAIAATERDRLQRAAAFQNIVRLTPLVNDAAYTLNWMGETYVGDRPCQAVKILRPGMKEVRLYFDKETHLLLKAERCALDMMGRECPQEELYSGYGAVSGYKYPARTVVFQNGRKAMEFDVIEFAPLERIELTEFRIAP